MRSFMATQRLTTTGESFSLGWAHVSDPISLSASAVWKDGLPQLHFHFLLEGCVAYYEALLGGRADHLEFIVADRQAEPGLVTGAAFGFVIGIQIQVTAVFSNQAIRYTEGVIVVTRP
jgi:hypothetical protein